MSTLEATVDMMERLSRKLGKGSIWYSPTG